MNKTIIQDSSLSEVDEIASSGNFTIELIRRLGENDYDPLIEISHSLADEYGEKYILNDNTIRKYFNREVSYQGGRGHCSIYYFGPQSFIITFSHSLA